MMPQSKNNSMITMGLPTVVPAKLVVTKLKGRRNNTPGWQRLHRSAAAVVLYAVAGLRTREPGLRDDALAPKADHEFYRS